MELEKSTCLTSGSTTKPQSSRQYGMAQRQKYRSVKQNRKPRDKPTHLGDMLSLTKEAKLYNGEKTISLKSSAGKTGQPPVKE